MLPDRTREHLLLSLSTMPRAFARIVQSIASDHPAWDLEVPGRFTSRQHLAHLACWEDVFFNRMVRTLDLIEPELENPDETAMAIELGFDRMNPHESLAKWTERRAITLRLLETMDEDRWNMAGIHPKNGRMTLEAQAVHMLGHDGYHLAYLLEHLPG